jgi:hypothetical protein
MPFVFRIMAVVLAYLLACVAAAAVLTVGALTPAWDDVLRLGIQTNVLAPIIAIGTAIIAAVAFLPALLAIVLAEGFALRSSIGYAALGGVLAVVLGYGLHHAGFVGDLDPTQALERQVIAAAGIAGGLVYWLFAGRKAGSWK